ncbi:MAG: translation initiation factor IF-3 [Oscillospiraceae bacterium]|nr:translation initiation factor IF-3 [Oscillospiraceae bacterium]
MRLIDDLNNQLGIVETRSALELALEKGLDLVEIAPAAEVPVCRIMDYGKYKFEKSKKNKEAKKKQKQVIVETKETKLSWNIDIHDFNTRLAQTKKFLEAGNKIKVSLEFNKGREMAHMELGYQMLEKFELACAEFSVVEKRPVREGRRITMFIAPKKSKADEKQKPAKPAAQENPEEKKAETPDQ